MRVPPEMYVGKDPNVKSRMRYYRLSLLLVTRPLSLYRILHEYGKCILDFSQSTTRSPGETIPGYWIDWDSWVHIEPRPIPTLGHSPFSLSLSLSRITYVYTHAHTHSLFTLPSSFFSFSFPFSLSCVAVVFVSVYRVRVPLQFFGFIYFALLLSFSALELRPRFLRFDIVYRSTMPARWFSPVAHLKKNERTYAIVCVSILHRNPSSASEKVGHRFSTIRFSPSSFSKEQISICFFLLVRYFIILSQKSIRRCGQ